MRSLSSGKVVLSVCLALLFGAFLCACGATKAPPTETPATLPVETVEVEITVTVAPETPQIEVTCVPEYYVQPTRPAEKESWCPSWTEQIDIKEYPSEENLPPYVTDQIIVTGRDSDVKAVVDAALEGREQLNRIVLGWVPDQALVRFPPGEPYEPVVIELYALEGAGDPARDAAEAIGVAAHDMQRAVFADLNFVTGHPHIVAGSPHIVAGSLAIQVSEAHNAFWGQWALGNHPGIGLTTGGQRSSNLGSAGQGVRVGVFDTSPFDGSGIWGIGWITPTMRLCVSNLLTPTQNQTPTSDHGLFVAGLLHAVAPESEIHLIQVLGENAYGDLNTLNTALNLFISHRVGEHVGTGPSDPLTNTVINLSLGFPAPRQLDRFDLESLRRLYNELMEVLEEAQNVQSPWTYEADELPVVSLETILLAADQREITVVAAAGNESTPGHVEPPEVPASYPFVIGVAASNVAGMRACFSNGGDVAAPGGDSDVDQGVCAETLERICEVGIIGPTLNTSPCSGYACWAGTSFSAPLVSGQAALILEKGGGSVAPAVVSETIAISSVITADPSLPHGIINVTGDP